jgi:5-methylthioadenosine/S-adenosylhomocysteine deaminase
MNHPSRQLTVLTANWVLPMTADPIEDGVVVLQDDTILEVISRRQFDHTYSGLADVTVRDYGNAVILPGLINIHSHLDYSDMHCFDVRSLMFDWITGLVSHTSSWSPAQWLQSAQHGARQSALSGISCVVDSSFTGFSLKAIGSANLRGVVGLELFGIAEVDNDLIWNSWLDRWQKLRAEADQLGIAEERVPLTVSPHAPYTVNPALWAKARDWASQRSLPVLTHLSESAEECRWISTNSRIVDEYLTFVRRLRNPTLATTDDGIDKVVADIRWKGNGLSPAQHLHDNQLLDEHVIAAHCIHLNDDDLALLAKLKVNVAHCPRSNARLGNGRAPLEKFAQHKIPFALGTDSLASCDDLNLLNECKFALDLHRTTMPSHKLTGDDLLRAITIESARILRMSDRIGSLEAGKQADIAVFALGSGRQHSENRSDRLSAAELLIYGDRQLVDLFVAGRKAVSDGIPQAVHSQDGATSGIR